MNSSSGCDKPIATTRQKRTSKIMIAPPLIVNGCTAYLHDASGENNKESLFRQYNTLAAGPPAKFPAAQLFTHRIGDVDSTGLIDRN
jgi:hypothetical protein